MRDTPACLLLRKIVWRAMTESLPPQLRAYFFSLTLELNAPLTSQWYSVNDEAGQKEEFCGTRQYNHNC